MTYVIDEKEHNFVGDQTLVDSVGDAIRFAKDSSLASDNMFVVSAFDQELPSHIFIGGICYKPYNPRGFEVVS